MKKRIVFISLCIAAGILAGCGSEEDSAMTGNDFSAETEEDIISESEGEAEEELKEENFEGTSDSIPEETGSMPDLGGPGDEMGLADGPEVGNEGSDNEYDSLQDSVMPGDEPEDNMTTSTLSSRNSSVSKLTSSADTKAVDTAFVDEEESDTEPEDTELEDTESVSDSDDDTVSDNYVYGEMLEAPVLNHGSISGHEGNLITVSFNWQTVAGADHYKIDVETKPRDESSYSFVTTSCSGVPNFSYSLPENYDIRITLRACKNVYEGDNKKVLISPPNHGYGRTYVD
ncbi:MAG: hypothetical protein J5802_10180 [Butyrivibrio sp.]|nr:hypothetical protein [Butyrivibrio sp.]